MILSKSTRATVEAIGNRVYKKFTCPLMFMKEKFAFEKFPEVTPKCYEINEKDMTIVMEKHTSLREWLSVPENESNVESKRQLALQIAGKLRHMHQNGYIHGDCHMDNVVVTPSNECFLVDFEYLHPRRQEGFEKDIDVKGGSFICAFDGSPRSIKTCLGYCYEELIESEKLMNELKEISKNQWAGLPYSTYHHPKFTLEGAKAPNAICQRDTKERFEKTGITKELIKGKVIMDWGCNSGAMLLHALQLGAKKVIGIDNHLPNINFCNRLFEYLGYPDESYEFILGDINGMDEFPECDCLFCFALSKWVDYNHLIKLMSESNAEFIFYEDNKHMGKIIKDIIPNYDCEFVWQSGVEGNSPPDSTGWGRMSYICRKRKEMMNIGIE